MKKMSDDQFKKIETELAKYIVSKYENVREIAFTGWGYSKKTGYWGTIVLVNGDNRISFSLSNVESISSLSSSTYHPDSFKLDRRIQKLNISDISLRGVTVVYSFERGYSND
ncbi:hypothetical protein [Streptococcus dentiloxodontae]